MRGRETNFNDKFNGGYSLDECLGLDGVNPKNKRGGGELVGVVGNVTLFVPALILIFIS